MQRTRLTDVVDINDLDGYVGEAWFVDAQGSEITCAIVEVHYPEEYSPEDIKVTVVELFGERFDNTRSHACAGTKHIKMLDDLYHAQLIDVASPNAKQEIEDALGNSHLIF
jgi:16S rRNA U1498 N3-methylase RsmE